METFGTWRWMSPASSNSPNGKSRWRTKLISRFHQRLFVLEDDMCVLQGEKPSVTFLLNWNSIVRSEISEEQLVRSREKIIDGSSRRKHLPIWKALIDVMFERGFPTFAAEGKSLSRAVITSVFTTRYLEEIWRDLPWADSFSCH